MRWWLDTLATAIYEAIFALGITTCDVPGFFADRAGTDKNI